MAVVEITWKPTRRQLRLFAWLQVAFFAMVSLLVYRQTKSGTLATLMIVASITLAVVGSCFPRILRGMYVVWMGLLFPMAWAVSHLLLFLIFFGLFVPIGLLMKLAGRDPMQRKFDRGAETYWVPREKEDNDVTYFKQY